MWSLTRELMLNVLKVVELVEQCQSLQEEGLFHLFNEPIISNGAVQYLRLLASMHLQSHADFFGNFVEAPNLQLYCQHVGPRVQTHITNNGFAVLKRMKCNLSLCLGGGEDGEGW